MVGERLNPGRVRPGTNENAHCRIGTPSPGPGLTATGWEAVSVYLGVDAYIQRRISELRTEIAVLQHQNSLYSQESFHTRGARHTRDLRQGRLQAIQEELLKLNDYRKRIQ